MLRRVGLLGFDEKIPVLGGERRGAAGRDGAGRTLPRLLAPVHRFDESELRIQNAEYKLVLLFWVRITFLCGQLGETL